MAELLFTGRSAHEESTALMSLHSMHRVAEAYSAAARLDETRRRLGKQRGQIAYRQQQLAVRPAVRSDCRAAR